MSDLSWTVAVSFLIGAALGWWFVRRVLPRREARMSERWRREVERDLGKK